MTGVCKAEADTHYETNKKVWGFRDNTPVDFSGIPDTGRYGENRGEIYTAEFKVLTALTYLLTNSIRKTAEKQGIREDQIKAWMNANWWPTAVAAARETFNDEVIAGFANIIQLAQIELLDRIKNGDVVGETEDGTPIRRPVSAKNLSLIASSGFDKKQIATGLPTAVKAQYSSAIVRADRMRGVVPRKGLIVDGEVTRRPELGGPVRPDQESL